MSKQTLGLLGLGVMGRNLALNISDKGYTVIGHERAAALRGTARQAGLNVADTLDAFLTALPSPRVIWLMVTAGAAVDEVIASLLPQLSPGDLVIDGGNSDFHDTERRAKDLKEHRIGFLGIGVSGGEEGARHGPSLMIGGEQQGWETISNLVVSIAARARDGTACAAWLGEGGAGHFVKMTHNGIEYADMQLIAECWDLMRRGLGLDASGAAEIFKGWNEGPLASYLIEITSRVLTQLDPETSRPLVDLIADSAGEKGTGRWTATAALDLGVPAPTIAEAVMARAVSARLEERKYLSGLLSKDLGRAVGLDVTTLERALLAAKIIAYAQGFALMDAGSRHYNWNLALDQVARVWRAGCIIRADFLDDVAVAFTEQTAPFNLMSAPGLADRLTEHLSDLRIVVAEAARAGIPIPALSSALAYHDGMTSARLPADLIQAQRDYFGAHTYRRTDRPGDFHTDWTGSE
ncbi:MAG: NADP-dependent phosphogluconate dehydrogenase [Rhodospirillaceae bacterium]|nr:NADP-dependent phosphogluconate dehydrogenase [Rhodospirillaceae bacterium]